MVITEELIKAYNDKFYTTVLYLVIDVYLNLIINKEILKFKI